MEVKEIAPEAGLSVLGVVEVSQVTERQSVPTLTELLVLVEEGSLLKDLFA